MEEYSLIRKQSRSTLGEKKDKTAEILAFLAAGIAGYFILKSFFDSDENKIVSDEGRRWLSDPEKMEEVKQKISKAEDTNSEIII